MLLLDPTSPANQYIGASDGTPAIADGPTSQAYLAGPTPVASNTLEPPPAPVPIPDDSNTNSGFSFQGFMQHVQDAINGVVSGAASTGPTVQQGIQNVQGAGQQAVGEAALAATNPLAGAVDVVNTVNAANGNSATVPTPEQAAQQGIISPAEATAATAMGAFAAGGPESVVGPAVNIGKAGADIVSRVASAPEMVQALGRLASTPYREGGLVIPGMAGASEDLAAAMGDAKPVASSEVAAAIDKGQGAAASSPVTTIDRFGNVNAGATRPQPGTFESGEPPQPANYNPLDSTRAWVNDQLANNPRFQQWFKDRGLTTKDSDLAKVNTALVQNTMPDWVRDPNLPIPAATDAQRSFVVNRLTDRADLYNRLRAGQGIDLQKMPLDDATIQRIGGLMADGTLGDIRPNQAIEDSQAVQDQAEALAKGQVSNTEGTVPTGGPPSQIAPTPAGSERYSMQPDFQSLQGGLNPELDQEVENSLGTGTPPDLVGKQAVPSGDQAIGPGQVLSTESNQVAGQEMPSSVVPQGVSTDKYASWANMPTNRAQALLSRGGLAPDDEAAIRAVLDSRAGTTKALVDANPQLAKAGTSGGIEATPNVDGSVNVSAADPLQVEAQKAMNEPLPPIGGGATNAADASLRVWDTSGNPMAKAGALLSGLVQPYYSAGPDVEKLARGFAGEWQQAATKGSINLLQGPSAAFSRYMARQYSGSGLTTDELNALTNKVWAGMMNKQVLNQQVQAAKDFVDGLESSGHLASINDIPVDASGAPLNGWVKVSPNMAADPVTAKGLNSTFGKYLDQFSQYAQRPATADDAQRLFGRDGGALTSAVDKGLNILGAAKETKLGLSLFHGPTTAVQGYRAMHAGGASIGDASSAVGTALKYVHGGPAAFLRDNPQEMASWVKASGDTTGLNFRKLGAGSYGSMEPNSDLTNSGSMLSHTLTNAVVGALAGGSTGYVTAGMEGKTGADQWKQAAAGAGIGAVGAAASSYLIRQGIFNNYLPVLKYQTWKTLTNAGIDGKTAGDIADNALGGQNLIAMGRDPNFQRALRGLILAPDWDESWARMLANIGSSNPQLRATSAKWLGSMALTLMGGEAMQYAINKATGSSKNFTWDNPGHPLQIDISGLADKAGMNRTWADRNGRVGPHDMYVGIPWMGPVGSIMSDVANDNIGAGGAMLGAHASVPMTVIGQEVTNKGPFGGQIAPPGTPPAQAVLPGLANAGAALAPIGAGSFIDTMRGQGANPKDVAAQGAIGMAAQSLGARYSTSQANSFATQEARRLGAVSPSTGYPVLYRKDQVITVPSSMFGRAYRGPNINRDIVLTDQGRQFASDRLNAYIDNTLEANKAWYNSLPDGQGAPKLQDLVGTARGESMAKIQPTTKIQALEKLQYLAQQQVERDLIAGQAGGQQLFNYGANTVTGLEQQTRAKNAQGEDEGPFVHSCVSSSVLLLPHVLRTNNHWRGPMLLRPQSTRLEGSRSLLPSGRRVLIAAGVPSY